MTEAVFLSSIGAIVGLIIAIALCAAIGPNFEAESAGMGLIFLDMDAETKRQLESLYDDALLVHPGKGR